MKQVLVALLVGIGIGVLVAPDKGSATRKKILEGFDDYSDDLANKGKDLLDKGEQALRKGKSKLQDAF